VSACATRPEMLNNGKQYTRLPVLFFEEQGRVQPYHQAKSRKARRSGHDASHARARRNQQFGVSA
jgi:hypothetical protein